MNISLKNHIVEPKKKKDLKKGNGDNEKLFNSNIILYLIFKKRKQNRSKKTWGQYVNRVQQSFDEFYILKLKVYFTLCPIPQSHAY